MFDIGFWELAIIFIVALLVIGPDKLPGVARTVGTWVGRTRHFIHSVKYDVAREVRAEEIKKALERDASLDELKQIMNTDRFSLEEEENEVPDFLVGAREDELRDDEVSLNNNKPDDANIDTDTDSDSVDNNNKS